MSDRLIAARGMAMGLLLTCGLLAAADDEQLKVGAANVDISPRQFPAIQNGGFLEALIERTADPLHARALVFDDGGEKLAIVVVDSCMIPRDLCDLAKALAQQKTGIASNRILISATHTHAAPSVMNYCLGSRKDPAYSAFLPGKIAEAIEQAHANLQPARIGFAAADAGEFTKNRRWIRRSDQLDLDPFGEHTVQAMMHPGHQNPDFIGPSGPIDPWLSLLSVQTIDGKPLALLGNFSMHYFSGHSGASSDYYGRFARAMEGRLAPGEDDFVAIMSQGTSGDLWWGDYSLPEKQKWDIIEYTNKLAILAEQALANIEYKSDSDIAMAEQRITLGRRLPDEKRLEWARQKVAEMKATGDNRPRNRPEVYAEQALWIDQHREEELVLQAIRIGDIAITGIPNEVYAITGLKLKARSPLPNTFNISLANGAAGYIPPPEQHEMGGYNTWPARTAGLDVEAEPKIVEVLLEQLAKVGDAAKTYPGQRMAALEEPRPPIPNVITSFDMAALGMRELGLQSDHDWGNSLGPFGKIAFAVPGVPSPESKYPHAMGFAGGRCFLINHKIPGLSAFTLEMWFWNGVPNNARDITGYLYSHGNHTLGISGNAANDPGRLFFANELGRTEIMPRAWNHIMFSCDSDGNVRIYLNGNPNPEISARLPLTDTGAPFILAGDRDDTANFEGRIDEITLYGKALSSNEVVERFKSFKVDPPTKPEWGEAREPEPEKPETTQIEDDPLSPEETMAATHVADGYVLELVAAEPEVADPVAIDWGADGKLWVAEMADYPYGMDGAGKPGGRVRYLEDEDGDGRYEKSTLFVDGLRFPTSVMAWRDGVLITAAPDLLFANDPDGDGEAQLKVLFTGFVQGNQQLRVNSLRWGLDNWIYCASGGHHVGFGKDTVITNARGESVELGSRDFRFNPDTGALEPQSGPSQFGRVRDDWGNWFGVQNSWPLWHYVLADHYLRRNPSFAAPDPRVQVRAPGNPRVYPNKSIQKRFHSYEQAGRYTSACGPSIYRDELLFPREDGVSTAFTCEPFHNVVQRHRVERDGVSFKGDRADDGELDFFASGDRWCRPVMSRTGPDGALYIVDMYRYMIEHPDWLPPNGREELKPFYRAGEDRGRIYRIRKLDSPSPLADVPVLADASANELARALAHPNGIVRDQAHRLLIELGPQKAQESALATMAASHVDPKARLQALCVLDGWDLLPDDRIVAATEDSSPDIRRHAARIAESRANAGPNADDSLASAVAALTEDPDAAVRLQAILSLGEITGQTAAKGLVTAAMFEKNRGPHFRAAIMTAAPRHLAALANALPELPISLAQPLFTLALRQHNVLATMLEAIDPRSTRGLALTAQFFAGLDARNTRWSDLRADSGGDGDSGALARALERIPELLETGRQIAVETAAAPDKRIAALQLLGREPDASNNDVEIFTELLAAPAEDTSVRNAAMQRLFSIPNTPEITQSLLDLWPQLGPALRPTLLEQALRRKPITLALLAKIEAGAIPAVTIPLERRQQLHSSADEDISAAAKRALGETLADRSAVITQFARDLVDLKGDAAAGAATFNARCAACHIPQEVEAASRLGPDLRSLTDRSTEGLLASILDPSRAVDPGYVGMTLTLKNGEALYGLARSETGAGYTLQLLDGTRRSVPKDTVSEIRPASVSLMPAGLESGLTAQELADLLEHVRSLTSAE